LDADAALARRWRLALALIVLAALALRIGSLGESLWLDEVVSVSQARSDLAGLIHATAQDNYPPLHNLLLFPLVHLVGEGEVVVRLPSLLCALATVLVAAHLARALYGRRAGLVAALLVALCPLQIYYAQEARMYSLLALTAALATLTALRWVARPTRARAALHALTTVLLYYSHPYAVFAVLAHNLWVAALWWRRRRAPLRTERPPLASWIALQAVALAAFAPWLVLLVGRAVDLEARGFWINRPDIGKLVELAVAYAGFAGPVVLVAMLMALRRDPARADASEPTAAPALTPIERGLLPLLVVGCTIVIPLLASFLTQPFFHMRYTIGASTAVFVLAAGGLARWARTPRRLVLATALVVGLMAPLVVRTELRVYRADGRGLARLLATRLGPRDVVVTWPGFESAVLGHYLAAPVDFRAIPKVVPRDFLTTRWPTVAASPEPLWLVTTWDEPALEGWLFGWLAATRLPTERLAVHQMRAIRFVPRTASAAPAASP